MWECFTHGCSLKVVARCDRLDPRTYSESLIKGYRLPRKMKNKQVSFEIDADIYDMIETKLWLFEPDDRLKFVEIPERLTNLNRKPLR